MWSATRGSCLLEDGCWSSDGMSYSTCEVAIDAGWSGFLTVEYLDEFGYYKFEIDGEIVAFRGGLEVQRTPLHGMAPRTRMVKASTTTGAWRLCQIEAMPPWSVTTGNCRIDREGCFESAHLSDLRMFEHGDCFPMGEDCTVEISDTWEGVLDVVEFWVDDSSGSYQPVTPPVLHVNHLEIQISSIDDLLEAGVHGMAASGTMRWHFYKWYTDECAGLKICPMVSPNLPGPWGDNPWTCTSDGDECTLPFLLNGVSFSACTQQFSDPDDADGDGSLHNGHPRCQSETGMSFCGPCSCSVGEEQTYTMTVIHPHTSPVGLVTCAPCAAGRFKSLGGSAAPKSCEACARGSWSPPGATACAACTVGRFNDNGILGCASCQPGFFSDGIGQTMCQDCAAGRHASTENQTACVACAAGRFNDYEMLGCASCQPGFFSGSTGQTMCQECAAGRHASTENQTTCDGCRNGSMFVGKDVGCQKCSPGTFLNDALLTACSHCDAGRFQNASGQTGCHCSAARDPEGPNPHLWTTMVRNEVAGKWVEKYGSLGVSDCGCRAGAWVDSLGHCRECTEGVTCEGMSEVEVLPGYFASADSAGFVWRCHGADWARCPGGRPGTCAQQRLNTSFACEECEPFTRMTDDGPCQARGVVLTRGLPSFLRAPSNIWQPWCPIATAPFGLMETVVGANNVLSFHSSVKTPCEMLFRCGRRELICFMCFFFLLRRCRQIVHLFYTCMPTFSL